MLCLSPAMNLTEGKNYRSSSLSSSEEDFLIKQILLTHDHDGRRLDSEMLLHVTENIMSYTNIYQVPRPEGGARIIENDMFNIEVDGSEEPIGRTIYRVSCEISMGGNSHAKTMMLFDMLAHYTWDIKAVLVLSAFAINYGEFWLIMQLYPHNPLAASLAFLKQLPNDLSFLKPRFKALSALVKTMVDVTQCMIRFEAFPVDRVLMDKEAIGITKSQIYVTTYWVIRSALICSSQITELIGIKIEQVYSSSLTIASWELSSLICKLSTIGSRLKKQVDICYELIETKMRQELLNLFKEVHIDNREVLDMLFGLNDSLPLKDSFSQAKVRLSELRNKVVILLVSKPELLPIETLLLLVEKMYENPHRMKLQGSYEIVWVPISSSETWTYEEKQNFEFLSNSLPCFSIRKPWLLNSIVVGFMKQEWRYKEEPIMVVLDTQCKVTNLNAMDMMLIWGARAYPFSISRENEMWEEETWNLQLLLDRISPLVSMWIEEDQNLCLYGSDDLDWIRQFTAKMRDITNTGLQLQMVYAGKKKPNDHIRSILATMNEEKLAVSLTFMKINFFWARLESMRRSKTRSKHEDDEDQILKELAVLLDYDENEKGWVIFGRGSIGEIITFEGRKVMECLDDFPLWGGNVGKLGLVGAIRNAIEAPLLAEPCHHSSSEIIHPFVEGLEECVLCEKCKRPMEKFVVFKCDGTE